MSKLVKRIRKSFKRPRNVLVVGTGFGFLEELCDNFASVFIISALNITFKKRNLIYREDFEGIEHIPDLDVIFIDKNQEVNVEKLKPILLRYHPVMFVEGSIVFDRPQYKFLQQFKYSVTDVFGSYHIWKFQK